MPKIRVDAEPLILSQADIHNGFAMSAEFKMPVIRGMEVDPAQKFTNRLTQPVKLRRNPRNESENAYHLNLTRFNAFRVVVPVILAEIDSTLLNETSSRVGCV